MIIQDASDLINAFSSKGVFAVLVGVSSVDGKDMLMPETES